MNTKTITIGIPAHNEESNISQLLNSILFQERSNFILEKVLVVCDGCSDSTFEVVEKYTRKHKFIKCLNDGKRLGKPARLEQLYKLNKSDIFIAFDGDTVLGSKHVVSQFVLAFNNPKVGLVGGADTPNTPTNFIQKVATTWVDIWYWSRESYNGGVTVNNHKGCASAASRSLLAKITVPKEIVVGEEDFLYFKAKMLGYKFKFAKKAIVYYTVPSSFKEYFTQLTRFLSTKDKIAAYFGDWVYREYEIPMLLKVKALVKVFLKEPFYVPVAIFFQLLQQLFGSYFVDVYKNGLWVTIKSTK